VSGTLSPKISYHAGIRDGDDMTDLDFGACDCMQRIGNRLMTKPNPASNRPGGRRVERRLTLRFDEFGWQSLESEAWRQHETLNDLLSRAAAYFSAEQPTSRAAMRAPGFKPGGRRIEREIRLELARDHWEALESEAGRQGIPMERLLEHASLFYIADLDSGRVAERILGRAQRDDEP
jgi:hypothetical protein